MQYEHMRFKLMSEVQAAGDQLATKLATLLTLDELKDLAELVDANSINQDFWVSLSEQIAKSEGS